MEWVLDFFEQYSGPLLIGSLALNLLTIIFLIINMGMISNLKERYRKLVRGTDGKQIEGILFEHMDKVDEVYQRLNQMESQIDVFNNRLSFCVQRMGIIRYNAFDDTGSDLSYSIALLDENNDGIILTGIYGRIETVSYAKPVKNGVSNYSLSVEELQALERAKANALDRVDLKSNRSTRQVG
ncbi:DUF4446 family protein [Alkaliphilus sp. MSJ-5]|uniref:DUF4446 family protein n=1 Tax=Alkaliphilus flagellatus TaxID=2841507 RepID=A0ABS6G3M3_9FIRM|nr:DUF4446 family protein [Alkaliphilus flagellatus]MBU5676307.1 DUF4446 family protein [Alkaliphilus flagellatus]